MFADFLGRFRGPNFNVVQLSSFRKWLWHYTCERMYLEIGVFIKYGSLGVGDILVRLMGYQESVSRKTISGAGELSPLYKI